ncbi:MAG: metalloregulator ArsR/SmtB family transcription factor [Bacillota bacterium]
MRRQRRANALSVASYVSALSDKTRRRILRLLAFGELTQADIVRHFAMSQPAIVKHLRVLKRAGLIRERRSGRWCYYRLDHDAAKAAYEQMRREWETILALRLESLKRHVETPEEDEKR